MGAPLVLWDRRGTGGLLRLSSRFWTGADDHLHESIVKVEGAEGRVGISEGTGGDGSVPRANVKLSSPAFG